MSSLGFVRNSFFSDKMKFYPPGVRAAWMRDLCSNASPERKRIRYLNYKITDKISKLAKEQNRHNRFRLNEEILAKQIEKAREEIHLLEKLIGLRGSRNGLNFFESLRERRLMKKIAKLMKEANDPVSAPPWRNYLKLLE